MTRDELIEIMARALSGPDAIVIDIYGARDALAAIEAAGLAIVPVEATEAMISFGACHEDQDHDIFDEGHIATEVYRAMIEAGRI